ncbi:hypothetical protein IO89_15040 [Epilithonimonas lactis]|uniref:Carboxypeptidase regulatory-like domain-containing protein n=1 Tax=Epilithonimonas lactis TaxID=421072 RepID=A0A085BG94_9FLAO|nr:hypothetical protein IO89_15040 [Epilithonimonas lactis]
MKMLKISIYCLLLKSGLSLAKVPGNYHFLANTAADKQDFFKSEITDLPSVNTLIVYSGQIDSKINTSENVLSATDKKCQRLIHYGDLKVTSYKDQELGIIARPKVLDPVRVKFSLADRAVPGQVSGELFVDRDGSAVINGTGIGSIKGIPLFVYLVRVTTGEILAKTNVDPNGTYNIPSTMLDADDNHYQVIIDTRNVTSTYPYSMSILPEGWNMVGEDYGTGNLAGSGVKNGAPELRVPVRFNAASPSIKNVNFGVSVPVCLKPGASGTPDSYSKLGITTKQSIDNVNEKNVKWPYTVPNGHIVLDSETKGFVITHVTTDQRNALNAIPGMMVYNTDLKCVQIYRGKAPKIDPKRIGWNCIDRGCNED